MLNQKEQDFSLISATFFSCWGIRELLNICLKTKQNMNIVITSQKSHWVFIASMVLYVKELLYILYR